MVTNRSILICILAGMVLAGCGSDPVRILPAPPAQQVKYLLGPGDKLNVSVFGNANLSGAFTVETNGELSLPLLGGVKASGRDLDAIRTEIVERLDRDYVVNPKVSIEVTNFRPFFIMGEVVRPGSYPYAPDLTARQAVAISGGFTRRAQTSTINLTRKMDRGVVNYQVELDDPILPGDTLEIGRRLF